MTPGSRLSPAGRAAVAGWLGVEPSRVRGWDSFCGRVEARDAELGAWLADSERVVLVTERPRAVKALLTGCGLWPGDEKVEWLREVPEALAEERAPASDGSSALAPVPPSDGWVPWFPVIDRGRCTDCGQCLQFCLFGVYGRDAAGQVTVMNPRQCKNGCPACARICPQVAIVFPLCGESPIDGHEIDDEGLQSARVKVDVDSILGSDVYQALAERQQKSRRLAVDREALEKALQERERCSQEQTVKMDHHNPGVPSC